MSTWLEASEWKRVQQVVPIPCVDVLPLRAAGPRGIEAVGLIHRDTPHQGRRWCLVGGRMLRNESVAEAVTRHVVETLGPSVRFTIGHEAQPLYVEQYFTFARPFAKRDPRQHSVALTYALPVEGEATASGEAFAFAWFAPGGLPPREEFGFEQDRVVDACLERLGSRGDFRR